MRSVIIFVSTVLMLATSAAQAARWVLYDDFSSSNIRRSLWSINGQGVEANFFIEDGKLVMERLPGAAGVALLGMRVNPDKIQGIRVSMTTSECDGDLVGSVQTLMGNFGKLRPMSMTARMLPQQRRIEGWVAIEKRTAGGDFDGNVRNVFTYGLGQGRTFENRVKHFTITWTTRRVNLTVSREGSVSHTFARRLQALDRTTFPFHALGASGVANSGPCRVTFDNVRVLR